MTPDRHAWWTALPLVVAACGTASSGSGGGAPDARDGGPPIADDAGPDASDDAEAGAGSLVTIPLTACVPYVFSAEVTLGGSQDFQLILDTGSTTLAVAALGCATCTSAGVESLYVPGPTAVDQKMAATAMYGAIDPSGWSGEIYQDWVGTSSSKEMARVNLVAIGSQSAFLVGQCGPGPAAGVLGFGTSAIETTGTNGFFDDAVAAGKVPDVFATRMCPGGGTLWLGGYDPAFTTAPPVYAPMTAKGWYTVGLQSIAVLGTTIPIPTGTYTSTMLDTGSSGSSIPPAAFSALATALAGSPAFTAIFGTDTSTFLSGTTCVGTSQTKAQLDASLPSLTLTFGSSPSVTAPAAATESYLLEYEGKWCPAIVSRAPDSDFAGIAAILGAPMLASNVVVFDRANARVGFAPHTPCP
jgi:hypothetical protein